MSLVKTGLSVLKKHLGVPSKTRSPFRSGGSMNRKARNEFADIIRGQRKKLGGRTFNKKVKYQGSIAN